jgi:hypothetical protein
MALQFSPFGNDQFFTSNGVLAVGYKLFTYLAGTTTKTPVYTDIAGTTPHTNPIILNSLGMPPSSIFLNKVLLYKFVLAAPTDTDPPSSPIFTDDNVGVTEEGSGSSVIATGSTTPRLLADRFAEVLRPEDYGALGNGADDTAALQAVVTAAAGASRWKTIVLSQLYTATAKISIATGRTFGIQGIGRNVSGITWTSTASGLDILADDDNDDGVWDVQGFGLYAKVAGAIGPALRLGYVTSTTGGVRRGPVIGVDISAEPSLPTATNYWNAGIELVNAGHSQFVNPYFHGRPTTLAGNGLLLTGDCTPGPQFQGGFFYSWDKALTKGTTASDTTEGTKLSGVIIVAANYGVHLDYTANGGSPGLQILGGHISTRNGGVVGIKTNQVHIKDVLFYRRTDATGTYADISLSGVTSSVVQNNIMAGAGISGTTTGILLRDMNLALIDGNMIQASSRDVGIDYDKVSTSLTIAHNNMFHLATTPALYNGVASSLPRVSAPTMDYGGYSFDGSTDYLSAVALSPIADGKKGTFVWYGRFANAAAAQGETLIDMSAVTFRITRNVSGNLSVVGKNGAGTSILSQTASGGYLALAGTYHILLSWDMAVPGSMRAVVNGQVLSLVNTTFTDDLLDYSVGTNRIGRASNVTTANFTGDMYLVWFDALTYHDVADLDIRQRFVDLRGEQLFLGHRGELPTGSAPILFLAYSPFASWPANRGSTTSTWTENGTPGAPTVASSGQYSPFVAGGAGVSIAETGAALATTATKGFLYIPTTAGAPTGVPLTVTGQAPLVIDTTTNKLYFYSSGTWRDAGP